MITDDSSTLRRVAWDEVFPWLRVARSLRLAISLPVLAVATLGVLLTPIGWSIAEWLIPGFQPEPLSSWGPLQQSANEMLAGPGLQWSRGPQWQDLFTPFLEAFASVTHPLRQLLRIDVEWSERAYWALGGLWNLLIWAFFGAVITRMAVVRYGRDEREGLFTACRFAARRYTAFLGTPLLLLAGIASILLISLPFGFLMRSDVGMLLVALTWSVVLLGGLLTTLLVLGLLLGWPLMWGALSAEDMGDVFEGAQRTFAYAFGRPVQYAGYGLVACVVGSVAFHLLNLLLQMVVYFSLWIVSWATGPISPSDGSLPSRLFVAGQTILLGHHAIVLSLAHALCFSYLFTAAGVIYLLVRRDADGIELDNVHMPNQRTRLGLPPMATDAAGLPSVGEETPPEPKSS